MKLPKKIAALLTVTLVASSAGNVGYADTLKSVSQDKLVGAGRWETAIEVSKKGWTKATEAIIVNDNAIADALAATPFAEAKNAPILLTGKDKLDERTKAELKRLGVKKVYLIGGEAVLSTNIETELKAQNIEIDRIHGATRELTAIEIAKRLDEIKDISEIAVVNGTTGLADAVSIAAVAADKDMAIILSNPNNGTKDSDEFIKSEDIKTSYIIGGEKAVSKEVESKLPNVKRIEGINRNETNAKVIETFYTERDINNAYVAKDGMGKEDQLIDALSVGVLAAKNDSPVIIVGNKLNQMQKDVTNTKSFKTVTQVGGNGNETAFNELKDMQGVTTYEVKTSSELNDALAKANANDVINVRSLNDNSRNQNTEIKSENAITINIDSTSEKTLSIDIKNGTVKIRENQTVIYMESGELVIEGKISTVNVVEGGNVTIINESTSKPNVTVAEGASVEVDGKFNNITVNGKDAVVSVEKDSTVSKIEVSKDASGTVIDNNGKVNNVVSNAQNVTVENSGTVGGVSGTNKPVVNGNAVTPPSTGGGSSSNGNVAPVYKVSEYGFEFEMPEKVVEGEQYSIDMALKATTVNQLGYSNALVKVEVISPDGANVDLLATDSQNNEFDIAETGQWGPDEGFGVSKDYNVTTPVKAMFSKSGEYKIELKLVDVKDNNKVITSKDITVNVKPTPPGEKLSSGLYYEKSENIYSITSAEGLKALNDKMTTGDKIRNKAKQATINIEADIDFSEYKWKETDVHIDTGNIIKEINGNGHTISNMNVNGRAMFSRIALQNQLTIKNITFDKANVEADEINVALISVQNYSDLILDNVDVTNSTFQGKYKVSTLVGSVYNEKSSTTTTIIKNCDISNCTVTATLYDFFTTGLVAWVNTGDNDKIELSKNTIDSVRLYAPNVYTYHAFVYTEDSEVLHDSAEGVTVTNCTFENR